MARAVEHEVAQRCGARGRGRAALEASAGPVHRLAKSVATPFGFSRVNASRAGVILAELPRELLPDRVEPFAWPTRLRPDSWRGLRRVLGDASRPVEHISLRALGNAMVALAAVGAGIQAEPRESRGTYSALDFPEARDPAEPGRSTEPVR